MRKSLLRCLIVSLIGVMLLGMGSSPLLSTATTLDDTFSLSITIQSRHISHFEACVPIRVDEPFKVIWGNDKVKDSFLGVLRAPKEGRYPITLSISEGGGSCRELIVPSLALEKPYEWSNVMSMVFQHIDGRKVVLSKTPCQ